MKKQVLGVKIDDVSKEEGLAIVESWLSKKTSSWREPQRPIGSSQKDAIGSPAGGLQHDGVKLVFTPGPEFLVTSQEDPEFKKILNAGDLNLPDGYGLKIFAGITHVVPGVEFMLALCELAAEKGWTVGLVGRRFVTETASELIKRYPKIKIEVSDEPVDILFVGLGHPSQEKFLAKFKFQNSNFKFKVGMGVGGSFDFISGQVPEPGTIYKKLGLKWLGRFISRPGYMLPKIFKAIILFPLYILLNKIKPF